MHTPDFSCGKVQQMGTNIAQVKYWLLLLLPWEKDCMAWWGHEQKAADTERSMRRGRQPRFQNCDLAYNTTAILAFKRCISSL